MEYFKFTPRNTFGSNCFLISSGEDYALVDPTVSCDAVKDVVGDVFDKIKYIFLTHGHFDHFLTLDEWVRKTGVLPAVSEHDGVMLSNPYSNCSLMFTSERLDYRGQFQTVTDSNLLPFGKNSKIRIIHTPGHTAGSITLKVEDVLVVGDTLFSNGGYGRFDLPSGNAAMLSDSITRLLKLDDQLTVLSGHGRLFKLHDAKKYRYI